MDEYYRIMAIDYGKKRVGIATTDLMRVIVSPYSTIENKGFEDLTRSLSEIISKENVKKIVVGCPKINEQNKDLVEEINNLVEELKKGENLNIFIQDESYSSKNAVNKMIESGKSKKFRKQKGNIDSFAAALILEEFLNENN